MTSFSVHNRRVHRYYPFHHLLLASSHSDAASIDRPTSAHRVLITHGAMAACDVPPSSELWARWHRVKAGGGGAAALGAWREGLRAALEEAQSGEAGDGNEAEAERGQPMPLLRGPDGGCACMHACMHACR